MKTSILFMSLFMCVTTWAHTFSVLTVKTNGISNFSVFVNNQRLTTHNGVVKLRGIAPGHTNVRVVAHQRNGCGNQVELFRGNVFVKNHKNNVLKLDRFGNVSLSAYTPNNPSFNCNNGGVYSGCNFVATTSNNEIGYDYLVKQLDKTYFDNDRVNVCMQFISQNGITTNQLLNLLNQLSFESSKLKLVKLAYDFTYDKQFYFRLNDAFNFSSSQRQLYEFLNSKSTFY